MLNLAHVFFFLWVLLPTMAQTKTHYKLLGLDPTDFEKCKPNSKYEECEKRNTNIIKAIYKKLASKIHPDKVCTKSKPCTPEELQATNEKFQALAAAMDHLKDPSNRKDYDGKSYKPKVTTEDAMNFIPDEGHFRKYMPDPKSWGKPWGTGWLIISTSPLIMKSPGFPQPCTPPSPRRTINPAPRIQRRNCKTASLEN